MAWGDPLATGLLRFCPLYLPLGMNTCPLDARKIGRRSLTLERPRRTSRAFPGDVNLQWPRCWGSTSCKMVVAISSIDLVVLDSHSMPLLRIMASASATS